MNAVEIICLIANCVEKGSKLSEKLKRDLKDRRELYSKSNAQN